VAVYLAIWRVSAGRTVPWRWEEVALIVLGIVVGLSYWLKSTIAIPVAVALLCMYAIRRRAAIAIWIAAALFALLTPFVYIVRGAGSIGLGDLFSAAYREEFLANLSSRFFQFESLMFATPVPWSEAPWTPLADLGTSVVPRVLWDDKPLSASARFTEEYLLPGLARPTDVGVLSLPGEFWTLGGAVGVVLGGLAIGVLLRAVHSLVSTRRHELGTLLLAISVLVALLLLNDGEGVASVAILVAIASVGWLPFIQRTRST
jgi:hypothetical protein